MIQPVNGHLLIEPVAHESFIASEKTTFEEIGIVVTKSQNAPGINSFEDFKEVNVGDRVYFDSWLAARYPKGEDGFYWLVKWEDVRAIEKNAE